MIAERTSPPRGSKCDCGKPATVKTYMWIGCTECADESAAVHARWHAEKAASDAAKPKPLE